VQQTITAAQAEFDGPKQDMLLAKATRPVAEGSPAVWVRHDFELRVLAPQVKGFVQPQSWYADLTKVTVV
jgi:peptide/nickel transport system substrate-binding protein